MTTTNHPHSLHTGAAYDLAEHLAQAHGRQSAHMSPNEENERLHVRLHEGEVYG